MARPLTWYHYIYLVNLTFKFDLLLSQKMQGFYIECVYSWWLDLSHSTIFLTSDLDLEVLLTFEMKNLNLKGVGKGRGSGGMCPLPPFKRGAQVGFNPPPSPFGHTKCSNFAIFSYFVAENAKFSWIALLANFTLSVFSTL